MIKRGGGICNGRLVTGDQCETLSNAKVLAQTSRIDDAMMLEIRLNTLIENISLEVELNHLGISDESKIQQHKTDI